MTEVGKHENTNVFAFFLICFHCEYKLYLQG